MKRSESSKRDDEETDHHAERRNGPREQTRKKQQSSGRGTTQREREEGGRRSLGITKGCGWPRWKKQEEDEDTRNHTPHERKEEGAGEIKKLMRGRRRRHTEDGQARAQKESPENTGKRIKRPQ